MRMRILISGRSMRGPTGVTDADISLGLTLGHQLAQIFNASRATEHNELPGILQSHPRRVVAAIFQTPQSIQKNGTRLPFADVSDDAAHKTNTYCRQAVGSNAAQSFTNETSTPTHGNTQ